MRLVNKPFPNVTALMAMPISADAAETIALKALVWLLGNDDLLPVFLGSTGADPAEMKERATERAFLASVLEFLTMDDAWVVAFCDAQGLAYDYPMQALTALAGAKVHWT